MPRGRWTWIGEVWRAIAGDGPIIVLLAVALLACGAVLLLIWR